LWGLQSASWPVTSNSTNPADSVPAGPEASKPHKPTLLLGILQLTDIVPEGIRVPRSMKGPQYPPDSEQTASILFKLQQDPSSIHCPSESLQAVAWFSKRPGFFTDLGEQVRRAVCMRNTRTTTCLTRHRLKRAHQA
jgi:hypothetical protein